MRYRLFALAVLGALSIVAAASAHEGHEEAPKVAASARPRVTAHSERFEVVAVREAPDRLRIWIDRFEGNLPVTDAILGVTIDDTTVPAVTQPDGTFVVIAPNLARTGAAMEVAFAIGGPAGEDLLAGDLPALPPRDPHAGGSEDPWTHALETLAHQPWLVAGAGAAVAMLLMAVLAGPRRRVLAALLVLALAGPARAQDDQDIDGAAPAARAAMDTPQRLPDGTVFLPKVSQRLLELRTITLREGAARRGVTLVGRVVADPNRGGLAQSINGGRVIPPEGGLPRLGQRVRRGQVLAEVEQPLPIADRTTIAERTGEIEQLVAATEAKLARAKNLAASGAGTRVQVIDTEIELDGLRRRRAVLAQNRILNEVIRAPADGLVATARIVSGQVVQAQDVLFTIVDPDGLWVEALVFGADAAALELGEATASVRDGAPMRLTLQGFGRALQQQATVVQFRIDAPPAGLALGQPVTVIAQMAEPVRGLILPRAAVVRAPNGESVVWRHVAPEAFAAAPVRAEPLDAARVLVAAGLREGDRVVVQGAGLVNQVR